MSRQYRPKAGFWIRLCVAILYPLDSLLFKIRWRRLDRIPEHGPVIIAVNHLSYIDTIVVARMVWQSGRIPRFLIKSEMFTQPIVGRVFRGSQQIPVYRGTSDAARSLHAAKEALDRGECVVVYPEGTLTQDPDRWPMQAKTGIARLALMAPQAVIIPIGQWGPHLCLDTKTHAFRPFPRKPSLAAVGEPVDLSEFRDDDPPGQLTLRRITDKIMIAVRDQVAELRGESAPETFFRPTPKRPAKRVAGSAEPGAQGG